MKVCHITTAHPEKDIRIFYKECVSLVKAGFDVYLVVNGGKTKKTDGIQIVGFKKIRNRIFRIMLAPWIALFHALKINAKVYHFHDPELLIIVIFLRLFGKKVIYDVHENIRLSIEEKTWIPSFLRFFLSKIYTIFERFILLFIHKLILAEKSYQNFYPQKKSFFVLNFPLDKDVKVIKDFNHSIRFVYAGAIEKERGIIQMLDAFSFLVEKKYDVYLDIAGLIFDDEVNQMFSHYLNLKEIKNRIKYHGYISIYEVYQLLEKSHIGFALLAPKKNFLESYPTKVFDYMLFGLPVIASDFELYKEIVEENNAGICVNYEDTEQLKRTLVDLLTNRRNLAELSENGMKAVRSEYLWKNQAEVLINEYKKFKK
ncbi:MAG: glycosyltransferase [Thiohalospira sp.]